MTTIHTRQLQQYTQDNYNNTHRKIITMHTITTIRTRQLQQYTQDNYNNTHGQPTNHNYTQDNYNNTHKTTTTIHTANQLTTITHKTTTTIYTANQQQLHTRQLKTSNNTHDTNYNTTCTKGTNTQARQYCVQFIVITYLVCSHRLQYGRNRVVRNVDT